MGFRAHGKQTLGAMALVVAMAFGASSDGLAQAPKPETGGSLKPAAQPTQDQIDRWNKLTPEQKAELRKRMERLKKMPAERQTELKRRLERFKKLSDAERKTLMTRYKRYKRMSPSERRRVDSLYDRFSQMSTERRAQLRAMMARIIDMPARHRAMVLRNAKRFRRMNPELRSRLRSRFRDEGAAQRQQRTRGRRQ